MATLPSFQSLLESSSSSSTLGSSIPATNGAPLAVGHYPLSDVGSSPFFSSSSSFFSSSSSFFSSSGELSSLLSSTRRGKESPVMPSSPCQTLLPSLMPPAAAPLTSFLGGSVTTSSTTTTTTHTTTTSPSAFTAVSAPAPCALPLAHSAPTSSAHGLTYTSLRSAVLPGPSVHSVAPSSTVLPFPANYALQPPAVYVGMPSTANMSGAAPAAALSSDARALMKKDSANTGAPSTAKPGVRVCTMCGTSKTKQWRSGSDGKPSLCNACGLRYRKDSLGQKFKFKQVVIFPSGSSGNKKRKTLTDDKSKVDSVDEKELTVSLAAAKVKTSSPKRRRQSSPASDNASGDHRPPQSREGSPDRKSDIYALLN